MLICAIEGPLGAGRLVVQAQAGKAKAEVMRPKFIDASIIEHEGVQRLIVTTQTGPNRLKDVEQVSFQPSAFLEACKLMDARFSKASKTNAVEAV